MRYDNPVDYIQNNAFLAEKLINYVNNELSINQSNNKITMMGISMGGLVGKYALLDMEYNNIEHNVQLFLTGDTPHQGANLPVTYQFLARQSKRITSNIKDEITEQIFDLVRLIELVAGLCSGEDPLVMAEDILETDSYELNFVVLSDIIIDYLGDELLSQTLNSPSAKQMLIEYLYDDNKTFQVHTLRQDLMSEFAAMGNYPHKCRYVAITNGSVENLKQLNLTPGKEMVHWGHDTWWLKMELHINENSNYSISDENLFFLHIKIHRILIPYIYLY